MSRGVLPKNSDIDLLVKFKIPPGPVDYIRLEESLAKALGRKVGLVSIGGVSLQLKPYIIRDLIVPHKNR